MAFPLASRPLYARESLITSNARLLPGLDGPLLPLLGPFEFARNAARASLSWSDTIIQLSASPPFREFLATSCRVMPEMDLHVVRHAFRPRTLPVFRSPKISCTSSGGLPQPRLKSHSSARPPERHSFVRRLPLPSCRLPSHHGGPFVSALHALSKRRCLSSRCGSVPPSCRTFRRHTTANPRPASHTREPPQSRRQRHIVCSVMSLINVDDFLNFQGTIAERLDLLRIACNPKREPLIPPSFASPPVALFRRVQRAPRASAVWLPRCWNNLLIETVSSSTALDVLVISWSLLVAPTCISSRPTKMLFRANRHFHGRLAATRSKPS